ncbi:hypothetical protein ACKWTF_000768 [Chironomus riparius]
MNSALASLTATYTDSENEDHFDDQGSEEEDSKESTPEIVMQPNQNNNPKKSFRLVSYNDIQEDEAHSDTEMKGENQESEENADLEDKYAKYYKKYGFNLPAEPRHSRQNPKLQEMVTNISQKMNKKPEYDLNQYIQEEKKFRNPSIYDKLIQYCALNELGTNFSSDQWDVSIYGPESYYEELAKAQKAEMDKHEKQKKENIKTEVISGKRKTKWDVQNSDNKLVPNNSSTTSSSSSSAAKTTTTVINAFGTLKKTKV